MTDLPYTPHDPEDLDPRWDADPWRSVLPTRMVAAIQELDAAARHAGIRPHLSLFVRQLAVGEARRCDSGFYSYFPEFGSDSPIMLMGRSTRWDGLRLEAELLACAQVDDDSITLRPEGGETSEGDVVLHCSETDVICAREAGMQWIWMADTIADYLAERAATNNWSEDPAR